MAPRLPPLAAIRVFEAAARHENFTKAAAELGMSQASVSYQIKVLEERIAAPLFLRRPRKVTLTREGRRLAAPTIDAFERLRSAYARTDTAAQGTLSISTSPTFASNWLATRLGRFQMAYPDLAVRVETEGRNIDFAREEVDVAIRYGTGDWAGLAAHELMKSEFTPMLSPSLLKSVDRALDISGMLELRIIDPSDPYWTTWLTQAGHGTHDLAGRVGSHLGAQSNEARAAISGQGVAMLTPRFFRFELETGRLVQPFDLVCSDGRGYWLIYPEARSRTPKIRAFRTWIESEAQNESRTDRRNPIATGSSVA